MLIIFTNREESFAESGFSATKIDGTGSVPIHKVIPRIVDNPVEKWITYHEKTLILHEKTLNLQQNYSYITIRKKVLPKGVPPDIISHAK